MNVSANGMGIPALMPKNGGGGTEAVAAGNASSVFTSNVVRILFSSGSPRIRFGPNPTTADATDILVSDGMVEYFSVNVGDKLYVTGGNIEVTNFEV